MKAWLQKRAWPLFAGLAGLVFGTVLVAGAIKFSQIDKAEAKAKTRSNIELIGGNGIFDVFQMDFEGKQYLIVSRMSGGTSIILKPTD